MAEEPDSSDVIYFVSLFNFLCCSLCNAVPRYFQLTAGLEKSEAVGTVAFKNNDTDVTSDLFMKNFHAQMLHLCHVPPSVLHLQNIPMPII
jgi:hypothetical protein